MSFVSINAQNDFISVMSDGLVCFSHSDGRIDRLEENCKKFFQISSKQFVAVTGTKSVLDYYSQTIPFLDEGYDLKELAEYIYSEINGVARDTVRATISVGGVGVNGNIEYFVFSNRGNDLEHILPTNSRLSSHFLTSSNITEEMSQELNQRYQNMLVRNSSNTVKQICKTQKEIFLFVEKMDETVNNKVSHLLIEK